MLRRLLRSLKRRFTAGNSTKRLLHEIAFFTNEAKNGRWYDAGDNTILTSIYTNQIIAVDRRDVSLAPHLILRGIWEMELTQKCESIVSQINDPIIIDVGANFGWYGLVLSRFSGQSSIHFFEANPNLIKLLEKTTLVNGLALRSTINNCAVSSRSGETLELSIQKHHLGSSSIHEFSTSQLTSYHEKPEDLQKISIQSISLDDYCNSNAIDAIDFLKIDVEGAEANVLAGASQIISRSPKLVMMVEWNKSRYGNDILATLAQFRSCEGLHHSGHWVDLSEALHGSTTVQSFEQALTTSLNDPTRSSHDLIFRK